MAEKIKNLTEVPLLSYGIKTYFSTFFFLPVGPTSSPMTNVPTEAGLLSQYIKKSREQPSKEVSNNKENEGRTSWRTHVLYPWGGS